MILIGPQQTGAEGKSGQRLLRAAYHVAAAAVSGPGNPGGAPSYRPTVLLAPSRAEESPASPKACLVEVQAAHREIRSSSLASSQGTNCWPFTAEGVKSKAAPLVSVWDLQLGSPGCTDIADAKPWAEEGGPGRNPNFSLRCQRNSGTVLPAQSLWAWSPFHRDPESSGGGGPLVGHPPVGEG